MKNLHFSIMEGYSQMPSRYPSSQTPFPSSINYLTNPQFNTKGSFTNGSEASIQSWTILKKGGDDMILVYNSNDDNLKTLPENSLNGNNIIGIKKNGEFLSNFFRLSEGFYEIAFTALKKNDNDVQLHIILNEDSFVCGPSNKTWNEYRYLTRVNTDNYQLLFSDHYDNNNITFIYKPRIVSVHVVKFFDFKLTNDNASLVKSYINSSTTIQGWTSIDAILVTPNRISAFSQLPVYPYPTKNVIGIQDQRYIVSDQDITIIGGGYKLFFYGMKNSNAIGSNIKFTLIGGSTYFKTFESNLFTDSWQNFSWEIENLNALVPGTYYLTIGGDNTPNTQSNVIVFIQGVYIVKIIK